VSSPEGITDIYILKGDGLLPANGDYRRLRITDTRKDIRDRLNAIIAGLNAEQDQRKQDDDSINDRIGRGALPFAAPTVIASIIAEAVRATGVEGGLAADIAAEATRALAAEDGLAGDIAGEAARAQTAEDGLADGLQIETARAAEAEGALDYKMETFFAPLESPHFSGVPVVPPVNFENKRQIVAAEELKEVYNLALGTAGEMLRAVDGFNPARGLQYERRLDRDPVSDYGDPYIDEYRETDNAGCCWKAPFLEEAVFYRLYYRLYDIVMSTAGENLLLTDGVKKRNPDRKLDRIEGRPDELREFDLRTLVDKRYNELYDIVMSAAGENLLLTDGSGRREFNRKVDRTVTKPEEMREFDFADAADPFGGAVWVDDISI
jgi:hypothetical protein